MTRARTTGARLTNSPIRAVAAVLTAGLIVIGAPAAMAAKGKAAPAGDVDHTIETAVSALEAGKADLAVQELTSAISGGKITQSKMARALYFRGLAYRKQSKPAQAIADFTSALWIKNGLDAGQRADALLNRAAAYRDAGLTEQAEADEQRVAAGRRSGQSRQAAAAAPANAPPAPSSSSGGGGLGGFFNALFGGGSAPEQPSSAGFATSVSADSGQSGGSGRAPKVSAWSNQSGTATAGWSETTVVRKASASPPAPATTASTGRHAGTGQFIQVAAVRSRHEAQSVAAQLAKISAASGRNASIDETVMGNMGTLYRVRLGPFASAKDVQSACPSLRKAGLDCMVIDQ